MDGQRDWMLELVSATEDRRDVCKLNGAKCFSTIDLRSGYYHID